MKTRLLLAFSVLLVIGVCQAGEEMVKQINRATKSEPGKHYVVFCARGGSPTGHAFVAWGEESFSASSCGASAYGLYPKGGAAAVLKSIFGPVPGAIVAEGLASKTSCRLIVQVDSAQFAKSEAIRKQKWNKALENKYELLVTDCTTFAGDIATSVGLKTPERASNMLPESFLRALMQLNN